MQRNDKIFITGHNGLVGRAVFEDLKRKGFKNKLPIFNIGTSESLNISRLAKLIAKLVNFEGKIIFDSRFPDGTFKKNLNSNKINKFGWKPKIKLKDGLKKVIQSRLI